MKKLFFAAVFAAMCTTGFGQNVSVSYADDNECGADLFFAVRTVIDGQVFYRLTVYKKASPGSEVEFNLDADMSDTYLPASDFTDPTRPQFGGAIGTVAALYYDARTGVGTTQTLVGDLCGAAVSKYYLTRDGEFHYYLTRNGEFHRDSSGN